MDTLSRPIYLDYAATTPIDPRVIGKMLPFLGPDGLFGNPASSHYYGQQALQAVEQARAQVAALINAQPREIIWTSGATEANNLAIKGTAYFYRNKGKHIITCKTEHKSVLDCCKYLEQEGYTVTYLTPASNGLIDVKEVEAAIRSDTILVSIMQVNNEIGVIQDIAAIAEITRARNIAFHCDAVQSVGKMPIDLAQLPVDLMSFSAHKLYGPKGVGALFVRRTPRARLVPVIHGSGQEQGLRSGTLATHQIVGMGAAFAVAQQDMAKEIAHLKQLRDKLWQGLQQIPNVHLNGDLTRRAVNNLNVAFKGINGESLLLALRDVAVSTGSACHSTTQEVSHVLSAIGLPNEFAGSSLRLSLGRFNTESEIETAIDKIKQAIQFLNQLSPL